MKKEKTNKNKKYINWNWSIKILFLSLSLSISFSIISEIGLNSATLFVSLLIIVIFLLINVVFDMVGVAITAGDINYLKSLNDNNVIGAKEGIALLKNSDKISVFCCDIVGDICGILSGACGASILIRVVQSNANSPLYLICSALISGVIASLTIFFKSVEKGYAVNNSNQIILHTGKIIHKLNSVLGN